MKIGILTYHAACNFGANLQVLSTYSYLYNKGYEPVIINWMTKDLELYYRYITPKQQYEEHSKYREQFLKLTKRCFTDEEVAKIIVEEKIEAVIVGSDAVAQHHPVYSRIYISKTKLLGVSPVGEDCMCPNPFWGSFNKYLTKKIPLVMMSVSSQNSAYKFLSKSSKNLLFTHLKQFCYISTRDKWTSDMISFVSNGSIVPPVTPDPVFAFNDNVYYDVSLDDLKKKFKIPDNYVLLSFHDSNTVSLKWLKEFKKETLKKGLYCVALPFPNGVHFRHPFDYEIKLPLSPIEWYVLIKNSKAYVGHNMHPIVVCLHNAVPCFSFDYYGIVKLHFFLNKESSKIYHIMKIFGVLNNRVSSSIHEEISPHDVILRLQSFDIEKIKKISKDYTQRYFQMMDEILYKINQK